MSMMQMPDLLMSLNSSQTVLVLLAELIHQQAILEKLGNSNRCDCCFILVDNG